jgi:hypothetical protein
MQEIGLTPSATGAAGGKQTGQQMIDYVTSGGSFEREIRALLESRFCAALAVERARFKR